MSLCLVAAQDVEARERTARVMGAWFGRTRGVELGDLLVAVPREQPEVVVVAADPSPPDGSTPAWVRALNELRAAAPQLAVVVTGPPQLAHDAELRLTVTALDAGARGYLRARQDTTSALFEAGEQSSGAGLSRREFQVLQGMTEGLSNAEIAASLGLAGDTVKTHARRLFQKLGAEDRAHAVARGFRRGLLS